MSQRDARKRTGSEEPFASIRWCLEHVTYPSNVLQPAEAFDNVREAIEAHCELLAEDDKAMPRPKPMSDWRADREYEGWTWGIVDVPVERFFGPAEKINITVPGRLLKQIDEHARAHGETRSGFLTKAALEAMRRT